MLKLGFMYCAVLVVIYIISDVPYALNTYGPVSGSRHSSAYVHHS